MRKCGWGKRMVACFMALLLAMSLLPACVAAEEDLLIEEDLLVEEETEAVSESAAEEFSGDAPVATVTDTGYSLDAEGFLTGENPGPEYVLEDEENGVWQYASEVLAITIRRYREKVKKRTNEYVVAEVRTREANPMDAIMTEPGSYKHAGTRQDSPVKLLEKQPAVFAISDDMYGLRIMPVGGGKTKYNFHGVIIRYGEVMATKTRQSPEEGKKDKRPWPNLDAMALYSDGSLKAYVSDAKTAEEYLAEGAVHVFAFGPWLISEGEINPALLNENYYPSSDSRIAMGMVEPRHYVIVAGTGRPDNKYTGVKLRFLADKLLEYGCTEALNLDGGATLYMSFMNKMIIQGDLSNKKKTRNVGSLIAFGLREQE